MTRDEFCALPPAIALGLVYDMAKAKLEPMRCPDVPRPPKYDGRISRKDGQFVWMSEMLLDDLEWWRDAKAKSAEEGGKYAEANAKQVRNLDAWILWRRLFPREQWRGIRGEERATGALPSKEPKLHKWDAKGAAAGAGGGSKSQGSPKRGAATTPPPEEDSNDYGF